MIVYKVNIFLIIFHTLLIIIENIGANCQVGKPPMMKLIASIEYERYVKEWQHLFSRLSRVHD